MARDHVPRLSKIGLGQYLGRRKTILREVLAEWRHIEADAACPQVPDNAEALGVSKIGLRKGQGLQMLVSLP